MTQRRILLHVGSPKCGSTFLQRAMLRNQATLRAHGIHYPHDGEGHPGNAAGIDKLERSRLLDLFAEDIHTVVLSHEDIYPSAWRGRVLSQLSREEGITVQLLAFLRPFSEFVFGDYSQFMKQFFEPFLAARRPYYGQSFDTFALRRVEKLQPATFLTNWQKCFGGASITVAGHREIRPVLSDLLGAHVPIDWEVPRHQVNPSLRIEDCDRLVAAMHDAEVPDAEIREMLQAAFHNTGQPDAGRTPARIDMIETAFAAQNSAILKAFGYDNRLPGYPRTTG